MKGVIEYRDTLDGKEVIKVKRYNGVVGFIGGFCAAHISGAHTIFNHKNAILHTIPAKPEKNLVAENVLAKPDVIRVGLSHDKAKEMFEKQFGVDTATRTSKQWRALVKQYGIEQVCKTEGMFKREVKKQMKRF